LVASDVLAEDCITTATGKTVCRPGESAAAVNPAAGTVSRRKNTEWSDNSRNKHRGQGCQQPEHGHGGNDAKTCEWVTTAQSSTGAKAVYNPNTDTAATTQKHANGVTTAQSSTGAKAAYNPRTGKAAAQQTNQNGVKDTQTTSGGQAKSKNGMGVAETLMHECAKGAKHEGASNSECGDSIACSTSNCAPTFTLMRVGSTSPRSVHVSGLAFMAC